MLVSIAPALLIGGGLAFLAHGVPWMEAVVDERIKPVLNSFPSIGWAILAAIWFDPGDFGVIFVETAILIPFCLINIAEGLRNIDRELMEMGRSFTRHRARIFWRLTLPLLVPYGLSATRIAYGVAWKIALVAELLGAPSGLGYLMLRAQTAADSTTFLAICFAIVLIFVAGERLVIVRWSGVLHGAESEDLDMATQRLKTWWCGPKAGDLRGTFENGVAVFRAVPYAAPPVGELRFAPPQSVPAWRGVRDASRDGPIAPQGRSRLAHVMGDFEQPAIGGLPDAQYLDAGVLIPQNARCWFGSMAAPLRAARVRCRGIRASDLPPTATWLPFRSTIGWAHWVFSICRASAAAISDCSIRSRRCASCATILRPLAAIRTTSRWSGSRRERRRSQSS